MAVNKPEKLTPLTIKSKRTESVGKLVRILGRNHLKCVTDQISQSWGNECYGDVTFICKSSSGSTGKYLKANKAVLAAGSRKLQLMLADTGDEDVNIFVPDCDFQTTKLLLQYIYTGEVLVGRDREVLKSLIYEWEIGYPEIISVESDNSTITDMTQTALCFSYDSVLPTPKEVIMIGVETGSIIMNEKDPGCPSDQLISPKKITAIEGKEKPASWKEKEPECFSVQPMVSRKKLVTKENERFSSENMFVDAALATRCVSSSLVDNFPDIMSPTKDTEQPKIDHGYIKDDNKKVIAKLDVSVYDSKDDEADYILSKAFLKQEKSLSEKLTEYSKDLTGAIHRHQLYVKHFVGPLSLPPKTTRVENFKLGPRIPCTTCGKPVRPSYMKHHLKIAHANERPFLCEQCGTSFPLAIQLKKHIEFCHPTEPVVKPHVCVICSRAYRNKNGLERHMTLHTGEKRYQCKYCDKRFRLQGVLIKHERTHTGEKPYLCSKCGLRFATHSTYAVHLKRHDNEGRRVCGGRSFEEPFKCGTCGLTFLREYAFLIHEAYHSGEDPKLPCRHCPGIFPSIVLLKEHVRNNHSDVLFCCDHCNNYYSSKWALDNHKQIHKAPGNFSCSVCEKSFKLKSQLNMHSKNVHSTERPFKCRFCPKDFKNKQMWIEHDRLHTGERPFRCPHCPKNFRVQSQYTLHLRTHTGEKPFACTFCEKTFASRESLRMHTKIHTGNHIRCPICSKIFPTHAKLRVHERIHSKEVEEEREDGEDDISDYMSEGGEETD